MSILIFVKIIFEHFNLLWQFVVIPPFHFWIVYSMGILNLDDKSTLIKLQFERPINRCPNFTSRRVKLQLFWREVLEWEMC